MLLPKLFAGGRKSGSALRICFVGTRWPFGEAVRFGADFLGAAREGLTPPFGVLEELFNGFEASVDRGVGFGGSGTLLERMLEKDIGFAVLVTLGSSFARMWISSSSIVPWEDRRSMEPFARDVKLKPPCGWIGDPRALRAGDCGIELCLLGGCAWVDGNVGERCEKRPVGELYVTGETF